ncbi:MAG: tetratricopeptide repeat protein [Gemmatimonadales bacterium]
MSPQPTGAGVRLRLIGPIELIGPTGPVTPGDPIALGLVAILAVEPDGATLDDLLLRLTPDLTPTAGRARLDVALNELASSLGRGVVERSAGRWRLVTGALVSDVTIDGPAPLGARERGRALTDPALPGTPEFASWAAATRARLRRTSPKRSSSGGRLAAVAALIAVTLAVLLWLSRSPAPVPYLPGEPLLLADVENLTGDTLFDRSLSFAARVALRQSAHVDVVPRSRIAATLRRMQLVDSAPALTAALAREVAVRDGIRYVIGLRAERRDPGYRVSATLLDAANDRVIAEVAEPAETRAGTLGALDRVLAEIRARLGEPAAERRARSVALPRVTTPSLEALRSYAVGAQAWSAGNFALAKDGWERAVALDTGFAMALGALGGWHYWHHRPEDGERYYREALARSDRLTEWERLSLESSVAGYRGDRAASEQIAETLARRFPSASAWYNYGTTLLEAGRHQAAIEAFARALELDPDHVNSLVNLATASKALGRFPDALAAYERAARADSLALHRGNVASEYGYTLLLAGKLAESERHFASLLESPGLFERTLGHRGLAFLAIARGRFDDAVGSFRRATEASRQQAVPLSIARGELFEGLTLLLAGDSADGQRTLVGVAERLRRVAAAPQFLALVGHGLVSAGRRGEAGRVLGQLRAAADTGRLVDRESLAFLTADLALAEGDPGRALALLDSVSSYPQGAMVTYRRAEALAAVGQPDSAIALLDARDAALIPGSESTFDWYRSRFTLAALLEARGDSARAGALLRGLADRWADGDVGSATIRALRSRLQR